MAGIFGTCGRDGLLQVAVQLVVVGGVRPATPHLPLPAFAFQHQGHHLRKTRIITFEALSHSYRQGVIFRKLFFAWKSHEKVDRKEKFSIPFVCYDNRRIRARKERRWPWSTKRSTILRPGPPWCCSWRASPQLRSRCSAFPFSSPSLLQLTDKILSQIHTIFFYLTIFICRLFVLLICKINLVFG